MKTSIKILLLSCFLLVGFVNHINYTTAQTCDGSLWKYLYHPQRFKVWKKCATVTGIVVGKPKHEPDGDYHIDIKLDAGQPRFLNAKNMSGQHGCFVVEVICIPNVKQEDAKKPCKNCPTNVPIPKAGDHISVTGTFVTDTQHGWNEIHPVYSIKDI